MVAAHAGDAPMVEWLVDRGADPSTTGLEDGGTAMTAACLNGHLAVVEYLLDAGADLHAVTQDGSTAISRACAGGHPSVVGHIIDNARTNHIGAALGRFRLAAADGNEAARAGLAVMSFLGAEDTPGGRVADLFARSEPSPDWADEPPVTG
ncbi:MAG: ankyrin repeat domain-containing protein, partial [Pseudomonadota bacterium]